MTYNSLLKIYVKSLEEVAVEKDEVLCTVETRYGIKKDVLKRK